MQRPLISRATVARRAAAAAVSSFVARATPIVLVAFGVLAAPLATEAQTTAPTKMARIGMLYPSNPVATKHFLAAFRKGMRQLGYVEGKTFIIDHRYGEGRADVLRQRARELVDLKMDVIVAPTDSAVAAVARQTKTIPIVMANSTDPVGAGLVASLAQPGGNVTGVTSVNPKLSAKLLQLIGEVLPGLSRAALIRNPDTSGNVVNLKEVRGAAGKLGLQLLPIEVRRADKIERVFSTIANGDVKALIMAWPTPALFMRRGKLGAFAQRHRLPTIFAQKEYVVAGGLISYGPSSTESYRRAAIYVDKILKGANPTNLPVELPTRFELIVNLKTAKALGITFPPSILLRATEVIE